MSNSSWFNHFFHQIQSLLTDDSREKIQNPEMQEKTQKIERITSDSRLANEKTVFFLLDSKNLQYLKNALEKKSICFCQTDDLEAIKALNLNDSQLENLFIFKNEFDNQTKIYEKYNLAVNYFFQLTKTFGENLKLHAVTGTNGKSSVVFLFKQIMNLIGEKAATIGTLGVSFNENNEFEKLNMTTPDSFDLQKIIFDLAENKKIFSVALEASSHGIYQKRINGLNFQSVCFTNFSQDHLDYHKTMDEYWRAKFRLFDEIAKQSNAFVCFNLDDEKSNEIDQVCTKNNLRKITYSEKNPSADIFLEGIEFSIEEKKDPKMLAKIKIFNQNHTFSINSIAKFQVLNLMAAIAMVLAHFEKQIKFNQKELSKKTIHCPPGRAEIVFFEKQNKIFIIDYAHTPDALFKILNDLKLIFQNKNVHKKILAIFGCGGDRDSGKRPIMGQIASENSDFFIITPDNPRNERLSDINHQILSGIKDLDRMKDRFKIIDDRHEAIKEAALNPEFQDFIILIAGKGHESEQIFENGRVFDFNDKESLMKIIS